MPPISALLFDLDGLLTDTETLHYESYRQVFKVEAYDLSEDFYCEHWIRRGLKIHDVCSILSIPGNPQRLREAKMAIYFELVRTELRMMQGAQKALDRFHSVFPMALVTSAYTDAASAVLDAMDGWKYFEAVVTASDVKRLKPDPEPWLLAATKLGMTPAECLAIEDAEKGITAANLAGIRSIAIPGRHTRDNDFGAATIVVNSLDDVTLDLIASL